jgi:hypothetical protein
MRAIGYLLCQTDNIKKILPRVDFIGYKTSIPDNITRPHLIVGWKYLKTLLPDEKVSILRNKIRDNLYWCFSPHEKMSECEVFLEKFYDIILNGIKKDITYNIFNIFTVGYNDVKELLNIIYSKDEKLYIYLHHNIMLYIYHKKNVIGISLEDLEYIGITKEKIMKKCYGNNIIFYEMKISEYMQNMLYENIYLIPFFKSLE